MQNSTPRQAETTATEEQTPAFMGTNESVIYITYKTTEVNVLSHYILHYGRRRR